MQNQWQELLSNLNLLPATQNISPHQGYLACLTELEYLAVSGPDRLTFLQGQMTCDFTKAAGKLLLGACCNLKGRASATFYALDNGTTTYLVLPEGQAAYLNGQLEKYAVFADVELSLPDSELILVGLIGETSLSIANLQSINENQTVLTEQGIFGRIAQSPLHIGIVTVDVARDWLSEARDETIIITNQSSWDQQQMALGLAHVSIDSQDLFIPQELNYDLLDGISFEKGCYKGQEIIARLHYRGSYKQRTFRFTCETSTLIKPGTPIYSGHSKQPCGHCVQSTNTTNGNVELLATIKTKALESESLHLEQNDGPILHGLPLPYAITNTVGDN